MHIGMIGLGCKGRWTLAAALFARFASRQDHSPAMKVVAALRQEFGGHAARPMLEG